MADLMLNFSSKNQAWHSHKLSVYNNKCSSYN